MSKAKEKVNSFELNVTLHVTGVAGKKTFTRIEKRVYEQEL